MMCSNGYDLRAGPKSWGLKTGVAYLAMVDPALGG